jgi:hypothetical protein
VRVCVASGEAELLEGLSRLPAPAQRAHSGIR